MARGISKRTIHFSFCFVQKEQMGSFSLRHSEDMGTENMYFDLTLILLTSVAAVQ